MQNEEPLDDRRDGARPMSEGTSHDGRLGAIDGDWEAALAAARVGDPKRLVAYVARRGGYSMPLVERSLTGPADDEAALMCRAAGLPWETFEAILSWRSRQFGRGPGVFGPAIRLYRDTTVETARRAITVATGSDDAEDIIPAKARANGHANGNSNGHSNGHANGHAKSGNGGHAPIHLAHAPREASGD